MQKLKKSIKLCLIIVMILNVFIPFVIYGVELPNFAIVESTSDNVKVNEEINKNNKKKYKVAESSIQTAAIPTFNFQSTSQILMEATTGEIIYANKENEKLLPASVTKIMTLLLIMEKIDEGAIKYTDKVTCSTNASKMGGSQIWFKEGETLTVEEALKCICVVSANDVSYAMSELVGGSHENFVQMMNDKAKALGMTNTNFLNSHGIDEEGHYTTAKDIALMSKELIIKHPDIKKYTTIWMDTIRNGAFGLSNTNKLIKTYQGITGLKTGSTSKAMFNLSATAERNGLSLIAVVMKAPTSGIRNQEVTSLLNYGFSAYSSKKLGSKGEIVDKVKINKYMGEKINAVFEKDEYLVNKKGADKKYTTKVEINNISAPILKNAIIGKIKFIDEGGAVIKESNLVSTAAVNRSTLWEYITGIVKIFGIRGLHSAS